MTATIVIHLIDRAALAGLVVGGSLFVRAERRRYRRQQTDKWRVSEQHQERAAVTTLFPSGDVQGVVREPPYDWGSQYRSRGA